MAKKPQDLKTPKPTKEKNTNMKIDFEIAYECFVLDSNIPQGIRFNPYRPKSYFKDLARYNQYMSSRSGNPAGALRKFEKNFYWCVSVLSCRTANHRIVWMLHNESYIPDGKIIDHIDRNTENNHPSNLRLATPKESSRNRDVQCNNQTGLKGVIYDPSRASMKKYIAKIKINNERSRYLGIFLTAQEAHECYKKACIEHHLDFSAL